MFWLLKGRGKGEGGGGREFKRVKNSPKWKIKITCHAPYLRSSIAYAHDFQYTCVKWWYLQVFFWAVTGLKEQKIAQNDNKIVSVTFHISGSIHPLIWFLVQKCKMMISPDASFIFSKFWFSSFLVGKRAKITKKSVFCAPNLRNHAWYDCHLWYTSVKWWFLLVIFSFFQNFDCSAC